MSSRITEGELAKIIAKQGYGIKSSFGKKSIDSKISDTRSERNLESDSEYALEGQKSLQINYTGIPVVRIAFYRYRLADHHRSISEKALVDALQYCGAIGGDSEKEIRLIVEDQIKVDKKSDERTEIIIEYPEVDFDNLFVANGRTDGR